MKAITTTNLSKAFGKHTAVDRLTLDINEGEIFGLLGLNGAGKTSTVMMLATLLRATSGSAEVFGYDIARQSDEVRRYIGVVFEKRAVDTRLTGRQNLDLHARMYSIPGYIRRERVASVLLEVGLEHFADAKVENYSGGMIRRLEIARSMITHPRLLLLDEPTAGVDVQTRRYLWDYVRRLNKEQGVSVFLATSYAEEADYLCDRVAILHQGRLLTVGMPSDLKASLGENVIKVKLATGEDEERFWHLAEKAYWVSKVERRDGWLELGVKDGHIGVVELVRWARERDLVISGVSSRKPALNDVVLRYIGDAKEEL